MDLKMPFFPAITPRLALTCIVLVCLLSLAAAFIGEHFYNLKPCILCLYQRYAYGATVFIALIGALLPHARQQTSALFIAALGFAANCALAIYQVLVEKKILALPAICQGVPMDTQGKSFAQFKEILATTGNHVPCDQVPWELFGISMAGYNALFTLLCTLLCLVLGALFYVSLSTQRKKI